MITYILTIQLLMVVLLLNTLRAYSAHHVSINVVFSILFGLQVIAIVFVVNLY